MSRRGLQVWDASQTKRFPTRFPDSHFPSVNGKFVENTPTVVSSTQLEKDAWARPKARDARSGVCLRRGGDGGLRHGTRARFEREICRAITLPCLNPRARSTDPAFASWSQVEEGKDEGVSPSQRVKGFGALIKLKSTIFEQHGVSGAMFAEAAREKPTPHPDVKASLGMLEALEARWSSIIEGIEAG